MKPCKTDLVCASLFFFTAIFLASLAALPAYAQRGDIAINGGETIDHFGGQSQATGAIAALDGQLLVFRSPDRDRGADVVVGGEVRFPQDTNNHASEQAVFGGPVFHFGKHLSAGIHAQIHRLVLPPNFAGGLVFNRDRMELLEIPGVVEYKFGPNNHFFVRAEGGPEFSPHFKNPPSGAEPFDHPQLDHGYFVRGTLGYNFGKWFVKGTYQTRYFKFNPDVGNPDNVYNWRNDFVTAGVGLNF
jgi:hypothetical protein